MRRRWVRIVVYVLGSLVVLFALTQAVPYGRNHTNPAVAQEPQWPDARTRQLAVTACFDCHSNQTIWRWYHNIAPFSWLVQHDVDEGRRTLNFSEWNRPQVAGSRGAEDSLAGVVLAGDMPPGVYLIMHPSAKLNAADKQALADGLAKLSAPPSANLGGS